MNRKASKPAALKSGDTVAVVAPAAAIEREHLERGVNVLASMGFRVKVSERALARSGILAGDDRERAGELQACFADPGVKAIFSARGGYGCGRLMPLLDFKAIARTPKVFVGFSDETFLLNALVDLAGMVSFHGPMVAMDFARGLTERSLDHMRHLLKGELGSFELEARESVHPGVKAIFSARGGYGCGRLMPLLDFKAIGRTPKVFVGFSDETFLLNALVDLAGMVSFHGPMVAMDFARGLTERSLDHMRRLLKGELSSFELEARESVHPGVAQGEVIGGCLSVLVATIGTPYAPNFDGRILFLEDTGEKAYRIDRMLVQLRQTGALARVAGIVFGAIRAIDGDESENRLIARFVAEQTAGLGCPVIYGIEAGHGTENFTLPFGVVARIDSAARRIVFTEAAVSS